MRSNTRSSRLRPAAMTVLGLLLVLAGCSSPDQPVSGDPTGVASEGPTSAAPGPSKTPKSVPPPATTAVPPATPGDVNSTVPTDRPSSKKPVKLEEPSDTGTGLTARVVSVKSIQAKAQMPGEIAGPAVVAALEVKNTGKRRVDLSAVVVTLLDSDDAPGGEISTSPAKPLKGSLGTGKTARGVYVFTVPTDKRDPITLDVTIGEAPVLVFEGDAS